MSHISHESIIFSRLESESESETSVFTQEVSTVNSGEIPEIAVEISCAFSFHSQSHVVQRDNKREIRETGLSRLHHNVWRGKEMKKSRSIIFGFLVHVKLPTDFHISKFAYRTIMGAYLGPSVSRKGHRIVSYDPPLVFDTRQVTFVEQRFYIKESDFKDLNPNLKFKFKFKIKTPSVLQYNSDIRKFFFQATISHITISCIPIPRFLQTWR